MADSGNGFHMLIPVNLPSTPETTKHVSLFLKDLDKRFSTPAVKVDIGVANPSRICKLYGSMVMKGDPTMDRPYRRSAIRFPAIPPGNQDMTLVFWALSQSSGLVTTGSASTNAIPDKERPNLERDEDLLTRWAKKIGRPNYLDTWLKVIMAVARRYPADVAESLLSRVWPEEKPGEYRKKIASIKPINDGITWGTVLYLAAQAGVYPVSVIPDGADINELVSENIKSGLDAVDGVKFPDAGVELDKIYHRFADPRGGTNPVSDTGCRLVPRRAVTTIAGEPGVGKSTFLFGGILMPMLTGKPVLGEFSMPRVKTLYLQSDNDEGYFLDRLARPYGYDISKHSADLLIIHTKNCGMQMTLANILALCKGMINRYGYDWIIIDNKTSLFTDATYGEHANRDSLFLVDALKKIAMEGDVNITIVEHCRKPINRPWELLTLHDVLGTSSRITEQVLGLNARFDAIKQGEGRAAKTTFTRRSGEGVIVPLKNLERVPLTKYSIVSESTPAYLCYEPFDRVYEESNAETLQGVPSTESMAVIRRYLSEHIEDQHDWGTVAAEARLSLTTVRKVMEVLESQGAVMRQTGGGRGHKTSFRVCPSKLDSVQLTAAFPNNIQLDLDEVLSKSDYLGGIDFTSEQREMLDYRLNREKD